MSVSRSVSIVCDGPGCLAWDEHYFEPGVTAAEAREKLRESGWQNRGRDDFCPHCALPAEEG